MDTDAIDTGGTAQTVALVLFCVAPLLAGLAVLVHRRGLRARGRLERPGWGRVLVGNALVLAFLLSVVALGAELYLRYVRDATDSFGLLRATDRWVARHYAFNNEQFRDDVDYTLGPVPADLRRVTFLGDSFTAGHGVEDVRDRFANRVRAARPGWEVQVFAQNGWDTGQQLEFLRDKVQPYTRRRHGRDHGYDLVVLVYVLNDVADAMPEVAAFGRRLAERRQRGPLAEGSDLADFLRLLWHARTDPDIGQFFPFVVQGYAGPTWQVQRGRLRALRAAVEAGGGRLAVVTFPFLQDMGPGYRFHEAHRQLAEHWREEGVPHLDLLPVFEGRPVRQLVVSAIDAHPNAHAHALAAEAMLPFLDSLLD